MSGHLIRAGHELRVYNRTASKVKPLVNMGATQVTSPADTAINADIVISIVSRTEDVQEVLLGEQGAVKGASQGALFIDMSTIDAAMTQKIGEQLEGMGLNFIDAPVSGGETGAVNATLTVFCGGSAENIELARPVLEAMGKKISHMGPCGAGQATKACNQILVSGALLGVCEALVYGKEKGLDMKQLIDATSGGAAQSWQLENLGRAMADGDFNPGFMVELLHKDLNMISSVNNMEITEAMLKRLDSLIKAGQGELGTQAVFKTFSGSK